MILALDPSILKTGVAVFDETGQLAFSTIVTMAASHDDPVERWREMATRIVTVARQAIAPPPRTARSSGPPPPPPSITRIASERPQIYQRGGGRTKADPNALLHMVGVVGSVAAFLPHARVTSYTPREWKGQTPKPVIARRIVAALSPAERAKLPAADDGFDATEAVGVGLTLLGRLALARVYPGAT